MAGDSSSPYPELSLKIVSTSLITHCFKYNCRIKINSFHCLKKGTDTSALSKVT